MNESTVSSAFQTLFRQTVPGAVVVKHADKSMIGMPDASITHNKITLWLEYKFIGPKTKGVTAQFMRDGVWDAQHVAESSPTQHNMMQRLAVAGHAYYIFWVLDHRATRKKVGYIRLWHPITGTVATLNNNQELILSGLAPFF
jgi:hypothetical protein